jgi:hypothetical protein
MSPHDTTDSDGEETAYERDVGSFAGEQEVITTSVYPYQDELIVELTLRDAENTLIVTSYQFHRPGTDSAVVPKYGIEPDHRDLVEAALVAEGYELDAAG